MLHLFDFSDDEHSEMLPELNQINNNQTKRSTNPDDDSSPKQAASISSGNVSADKVMESLLSNHRPRYRI